jgi:acyl-CoA reductase-like NAD-dependent aldehyde dehydrogenase
MSTQIDRMNELFRDQKKAFDENRVPSAAQRQEHLGAVAAMLLANRSRIHAALGEDFSCHPSQQADFVEFLNLVGRAQYNSDNLQAWMEPSQREADQEMYGNSAAYVAYQPKGVVGNMSPWNFPFDLSVGPLCDMLAAGNRVMLKPSEMAPACAQLLDEMISATFDEDHVAVVQGDVDVARAFPALPWDHLLYTGNPEVARLVAQSAAANLTPLTLELGGKSPAIFSADSINTEAIGNLLRIKMVKNGQMCVSPDYALVPADQLEKFIELAQSWFKLEAPDYIDGDSITGIISGRHYLRIQALLDGARDSGARIVQLSADSDVGSLRMAMSLVVAVPADSAVMTDEIFGPLLPVVTYKTVDEALSFINARERPLGLYLYARDSVLKERVLAETSSGGVTINGAALHSALPSMEFGGTGNSGYGRHHGIAGFREFSNARGVFELDPEAPIINIAPPYGEIADTMVSMALAE